MVGVYPGDVLDQLLTEAGSDPLAVQRAGTVSLPVAHQVFKLVAWTPGVGFREQSLSCCVARRLLGAPCDILGIRRLSAVPAPTLTLCVQGCLTAGSETSFLIHCRHNVFF